MWNYESDLPIEWYFRIREIEFTTRKNFETELPIEWDARIRELEVPKRETHRNN